MYRKTIEKIIAELKSENYRGDYVLGILETLLESLPTDTVSSTDKITTLPQYVVSKNEALDKVIDEASILNNSASAILGKIDKKAIQTE